LPLTTWLSQLLVAFIIEFDNEFEQRMPHSTTIGSRHGPWLVSMAGWYFMNLVGEQGVTAGELQQLALGVTLPLAGMQRWGYVVVAPDPADKRPKPPARDWLIRPTRKGSVARELWRPLFGEIEERWQSRFGKETIPRLRGSLTTVVDQFDAVLPDSLPVLGYGLFAQVLERPGRPATGSATEMSLPALLSKVLLTITLAFEREWPISLPVSLNGIRIMNEAGIPLRDLPRLSGVSKEAVGFMLTFLRNQGYVEMAVDAAVARGKLVRLTPKGLSAQVANRNRLATIEGQFRSRFGEGNVDSLQECLLDILERRDGDQPVLAQGLIPPPNCWRARKPYVTQTLAILNDPVAALPHYPMVLHRGGYPDGS